MSFMFKKLTGKINKIKYYPQITTGTIVQNFSNYNIILSTPRYCIYKGVIHFVAFPIFP